jgi:hypothetical protein
MCAVIEGEREVRRTVEQGYHNLNLYVDLEEIKLTFTGQSKRK